MSKKQRRLAFVVHDLNPWGGHDRSVLEIARRISHRWPVDIYAFTLHDPKGLQSWGDVRFHPVFPKVSHPVFLKSTWFYAATVPMLKALPRIKGEPKPLIHATGSCALVSDVVQVQFVNTAWKEKSKSLNAELCSAPRAREKNPLKSWLGRTYHDVLLDYNILVEKAVYTKEKTYIAIAQCVADELEQYFGIHDNIHIIHHGVDPAQFCTASSSPQLQSEREKLRAKLGIRHDEVAAVFVGTYERKGLATAVEALSYMKKEAREKIRLLAVGDGPAEAFRARAEKLGVADRVIFVGHTKDIIPYYRASDLFVLPTYYEPFGLVIIEAMSCGLAPVVSKLAGASELIHDGETGHLIQDPTNAREAARYLESLVLNQEARQRMGSQARQVAENRSWDRVADEYVAVLEPLLVREQESA